MDTSRREGGIRLFDLTDAAAIFEKILFGATRASFSAVWVDGRLVAGNQIA